MNRTYILPLVLAIATLTGCGSLDKQRTQASEDPNVQINKIMAH